MSEESPDRSGDQGDQPLDTATMWENLCLADELSEDCLALAAGLEADSAGEPPKPSK